MKALLVTSAITTLAAAPALADHGNQFYLGAELGFEQHEIDGIDDDGGDVDGLYYGIFGGYEYGFGRAYVAGEVNYTLSNADNDQDVEAEDSYGVGVLAGYNVTEFVSLYGRLGYQIQEVDTGDLGAGDLEEGGIRYGVGVNWSMPAFFHGRLEYTRTNYDDFDGQDFDLDTDRVSVSVYRHF